MYELHHCFTKNIFSDLGSLNDSPVPDLGRRSPLTLGIANTIVALVIAVIKMSLVMLFFMHVRYNTRITWIFAAAGFVWFLIMVSLTMTDYLSRGRVRPYNRTISFWNETRKDDPGK